MLELIIVGNLTKKQNIISNNQYLFSIEIIDNFLYEEMVICCLGARPNLLRSQADSIMATDAVGGEWLWYRRCWFGMPWICHGYIDVMDRFVSPAQFPQWVQRHIHQ